MKTKKTKNQKPIDIETNFRYLCPNINCRFDHWISLTEASTKNFKIVCDCGFVFRPKQIAKLKIIYVQKNITKDNNHTSKTHHSTDINLIDKSIILLNSLGFTEQESLEMVNKAIKKESFIDEKSLVKYVLQHFGELNEYDQKTN